MPRGPKRVKASDDTVRVTLLLPANDVRAIDEAAIQRSENDAYGRKLTRSDVVRMAVHAFLTNPSEA